LFLVSFDSPVLDDNGGTTPGRQTMSFHPPVQ